MNVKALKKTLLISALCLMMLIAVICGSGYLVSRAEEGSASNITIDVPSAAHDQTTTADSFLIGSWVSYYSESIDSHATQTENMAKAGINFNIFPYVWNNESSDLSDGKAFYVGLNELYARNNMVYMMNDYVANGYSWTDEHAQQVTSWAEGLSNCIGYYVIDEPSPTIYDDVVRYYHKLEELDPDRFPMVNLLPAYAGQTYTDYVNNWINAVGADHIKYLGHDFYALSSSGATNYAIFDAMEVIRKAAYDNGKLRTHAFPQSGSWNNYRMPNANELRWNAYAYVAYGFKALSWFNLVTPGGDGAGGFTQSIIHKDGVVYDVDLYKDFAEINWSIRGIGDALMNLDTTHAYHTVAHTQSVEMLPDDFPIQPIGKTDIILSQMESKTATADDAGDHIMVFNNSQTETVTVNLAIDRYSNVSGIQWANPATGNYDDVDIGNLNFAVTLKPGEGKLFKIIGGLDKVAMGVPQISVASGRYSSLQTVTIAPPAGQEGAEIYYTLDGTYPTVNSTKYTGAITVGDLSQIKKYTLRAISVVDGRVSEVALGEYTIMGSEKYNKKLYDGEAADFTAVGGSWSKSGNRITHAAGTQTARENYLYTAEKYDAVVIAAQLHVGSGSGKVGFTVSTDATASAHELFVGVDENGVVSVEYDGTAHPTTTTIARFDNESFDLKLVKLYNDIIVYVNDREVLAVVISDADFGNAYVGLGADGGVALDAYMLRVSTIDSVRDRVYNVITSVQSAATLKVDLNTPIDEVVKQLPTTIRAYAAGGVSGNVNVEWSCDNYDRTESGNYVFVGKLTMPEDSLLLNTKNLTAKATVLVRYNLLFWQFEDLLATIEKLNPEDYTESSWNNLKKYYDNAVDLMQERDDTSALIGPLVRYLTETLAALENPSLKWYELNLKLSECACVVTADYTTESVNLFTAVYDNVKAMPTKGPITQAEIDERCAKLDSALNMLVSKKAPTEDLTKLVATAKALKTSGYTKSSVNKLNAAVANAESVLKKQNAGAIEIEACESNLRDAMRGLTTAQSNEKSGCGSSVLGYGYASVALALIAAFALALVKRRKSRI